MLSTQLTSTINPTPQVECPDDGLFELIDKRTRTGKVFLLKSGLNRQVLTIGHQHYWDGEAWIDVNCNVAQTEFGFESVGTSYFFNAHQTGVGCNYRSRVSGFSRMKLLSVGHDAPAQVIPLPEDNCLYYESIAQDTDFHWQLIASKVAAWITLHGPNAPRTWTWEFIHKGVQIARNRVGIDAQGRKLEINVDIQTEEISPGLYRTVLTKEWTGRVGTKDKRTRKIEWSEDPTYPVAIDPDISEQIIADADDGHEYYENSIFYSNNIYFGYDGNYYHAGWRFQSVAVPLSETTIDLAVFKIYQISPSTGTDAGAGYLYGYNVDDPVVWSDSIRPSQVAFTTAKTVMPATFAAEDRSFTVTTIIQELVNRAGWATGNNMSLLAYAGDYGGQRTQFSDYPSSAKHGRLEIDFTSATEVFEGVGVMGLSQAVNRAANF